MNKDIKNVIENMEDEEYDLTVREFLDKHPELDVDDEDLFKEEDE